MVGFGVELGKRCIRVLLRGLFINRGKTLTRSASLTSAHRQKLRLSSSLMVGRRAKHGWLRPLGYEPDNPVLDNIADLRAATPTDAAKRVVPSVAEEYALVDEARSRMAATSFYMYFLTKPF